MLCIYCEKFMKWLWFEHVYHKLESYPQKTTNILTIVHIKCCWSHMRSLRGSDCTSDATFCEVWYLCKILRYWKDYCEILWLSPMKQFIRGKPIRFVYTFCAFCYNLLQFQSISWQELIWWLPRRPTARIKNCIGHARCLRKTLFFHW